MALNVLWCGTWVWHPYCFGSWKRASWPLFLDGSSSLYLSTPSSWHTVRPLRGSSCYDVCRWALACCCVGSCGSTGPRSHLGNSAFFSSWTRRQHFSQNFGLVNLFSLAVLCKASSLPSVQIPPLSPIEQLLCAQRRSVRSSNLKLWLTSPLPPPPPMSPPAPFCRFCNTQPSPPSTTLIRD